MTVTADNIKQVRRMIAETGQEVYSDADLTAAISKYPLVDMQGQPPFIHSVTVPYTFIVNQWWAETYDLAAAAADIWAEKAAVLAGNFDFSADGGNYTRSQAYEQAMKQSRYYAARRSIAEQVLRPEPTDLSDLAYGNELTEDD
jgi:hypothetical protein